MKKPLKFCVVGNPVQHSLSPWIHTQFARQCGLEIIYTKEEITIECFDAFVLSFFETGGTGLNITMPFKQQAYALAAKCTERAAIAKAVNTMLLNDDKLQGDNTDGIGLIRDITQNKKYPLTHKRILILGAGGAVRGILQFLLNENPINIVIANRTLATAQSLLNEFAHTDDQLKAVTYAELSNSVFDVVIDATGFNADLQLQDSVEFAKADSLAYDLKYSPREKTFLQHWAERKNIPHVYDGFGMLVEQAAESFYLWTGKFPNTSQVINQGLKEFYLF